MFRCLLFHGTPLDGLKDSKYLSRNFTPKLDFQFPFPVMAAESSLTSANDVPDWDPTSWIRQGSIENVVFMDLDTHEMDGTLPSLV